MPLVAVGSFAAHALAYRLVFPEQQTRALAYADSGHDYLKLAPVAFAVCLALALGALIARTHAAARGRPRGAASLWPFLVLPFILYTVQEHAERILSSGAFPLDVMLEPTFVLGILLQLPLALGAFALARLLLRLSDEIAQILSARPVLRPRRRAHTSSVSPTVAELARVPILALQRAGRAPPSLQSV